MAASRIALKLLAYGDSVGVAEALVGDLFEEIARGRSGWWLCRQLIGLYLLAAIARARRARLTPHAVAIALCAALLVGASVVSMSRALEAWLGVYYVSGTLSLLAHMAWDRIDSPAQEPPSR